MGEVLVRHKEICQRRCFSIFELGYCDMESGLVLQRFLFALAFCQKN